MRRFLAGLFVWLLPLIVVAEYVGTTFGDTVGATFALLAVFVGALWISPPEHTPPEPPRWLVWIGRALGLFAVAAGLWLMAQALLPLLAPKTHPMPTLANQRQRELFLYTPMLAAYPVAFGLRLLHGRSTGRDVERLGILMALGLLAHQVGQLRVQGLPVLPYGRPGLDSVTLSAAVVLCALLFLPRVPPLVRMLALLGAGLGLRYVGLETWKIDPSTRDMLPLVKSAQDAFFSGRNPYGLHQMQPGSVVPLTYLPGMWLLWSLPRWFGALDFRLMGLVADAAVVGGLFWAASGLRPARREHAQGAAIGFGAAWLFSPSMAWNGIYAEPHAWWFVLAIVLAATLKKNWWLAAFALGIALATRHFAAVVAPFVIVAMLRDLGWRAALSRVALTGVVTAALLVPFVWRNPDAFWFGTFRWLVEYGPVHEGWFWEKFGFSGPLYRAHKTEWMPRAQVALPALFLLIAVFVRGRRRVIAPLGTAYVLFVMFNGIIWDSFYLGCALFAAFAVASDDTLTGNPSATRALAAKAPAQRAPAKWRLRLALAGLLLSGLAALYLVRTLAVAHSVAGASLARELLANRMKPGDVLVDRADWNVAFIHAKPLFATSAPPGPTAREPLDPAFGPYGVFGHETAWFTLRTGRENEILREFRKLGRPLEDRRLGHYRLLGVSTPSVLQALSGLPGSAPARPCRLGGVMRSMIWTAPSREHPATASVRATFTDKLALVAGFDDSGMVWGRKRARVELFVDGGPVGSFWLPNLPGTRLVIVDTARLAGAEHDVELRLSTRDVAGRALCVDGWLLGRAAETALPALPDQ